MRKPMFDENDRYSDEANEISMRASRCLRPIITEFGDAGYSVRQISVVLIEAVHEATLDYLLSEQRKETNKHRTKFSKESSNGTEA
jgi:hypothetical protein